MEAIYIIVGLVIYMAGVATGIYIAINAEDKRNK